MPYVFRKFSFPFFLVLALATGCGNSDKDAATVLAGSGSKTWQAEIDTRTFDERDRFTTKEWNQKITFYTDGRFTMTSSPAPTNGTWTHQPDKETLTLSFEQGNITQEFQLRQLTKNEAKLVSANGTVIELEAE